ncbi:MAG: hypothetical protein QXR26_03275 [Candidatus Caldarchaeum sp.]
MTLTKKTAYVFLAVLLAAGFTARFGCWINPGYCVTHATAFDIGTYTVFSMAYVEAVKTGNLTALTGINPGVPPLSMILTGLSISLFAPYMETVQAGLLLPITASTLTAIPVYLAVRKHSEKHALFSAALFLFDPFTIQYSVAYLDAVGTLFAALSTVYMLSGKSLGKAVLTASLAALTKLSFIIFLTILAILLITLKKQPVRTGVVYIVVPPLSLLLSPWMWSLKSVETGVVGNLQFNNLPFSAVLGPFVIDVPQSLPWYILSYLGMGVVSWNTFPYIIPLALLAVTVWLAVQRHSYRGGAFIPAAAAVLSVALLPRNYWTYSWGAGAVQGVLIRQFYPYYFYITSPFLAMLTAQAIGGGGNGEKTPRIIFYPPLFTALLSPLAVAMNLGMPYWDFIFNLIYSFSQGLWVVEGFTALLLTLAALTTVFLITETFYRRLS